MFALPTLSLGGIAALLAVGLALVLVQPLLFGWSARAVGEESTGFLAGALALVLGGVAASVATLGYTVTLGLLMVRLGQAPFALGGLLVGWVAAGFVYSGFLRVAVVRGMQVAAVYWLASGLLSTAVGALVRWLI